MSDLISRIGRREFVRVSLLLGIPFILSGCGAEGEGTVKPPVERGGKKRLEEMGEETKRAAALRAAKSKKR
jgi:hypothetical protein